jgi:hypothetical protein
MLPGCLNVRLRVINETNGGIMSKLHAGLLGVGLCFGLNAAVAQNVDSEKDRARAQNQSMEQKDKGASDQTENSKFEAGKPQQSEADRGEKGRDEVGAKHFDEGKPGQTEATQERNTQTQPKQR